MVEFSPQFSESGIELPEEIEAEVSEQEASNAQYNSLLASLEEKEAIIEADIIRLEAQGLTKIPGEREALKRVQADIAFMKENLDQEGDDKKIAEYNKLLKKRLSGNPAEYIN